MKKKTKPILFLETSGVIFEVFGHKLMKDAVAQRTADGKVSISSFIQMEFLRATIIVMIELYFTIKEDDDVKLALEHWTNKYQFKHRKNSFVLQIISDFITDQDDPDAKDKTLRRLGDGIYRAIYYFEDSFKNKISDNLKCQLGKITFPREEFSEDSLLKFNEDFKRIYKGKPSCNLCEFKEKTVRSYLARGIDLYSENQRKKYKSNKGYVKQAERIEKKLGKTGLEQKCSHCEELGDSLIVTHMKPDRLILVTVDKGFEAFCDILDKEIRLIPSLLTLLEQYRSNQQ